MITKFSTNCLTNTFESDGFKKEKRVPQNVYSICQTQNRQEPITSCV